MRFGYTRATRHAATAGALTRAVIVAAVVVSVIALSAAAPAQSASAGIANELLAKSLSIPLAPGVSFERRTALTAAGWLGVSIIRIDLTSPYIAVGPTLANGVLTSPAKATEIAEATDLAAAINGDFFDAGVTSAPLSLLIADGRLVRSPRNDPDFASIAISGDMGILGSWAWSGQLLGPDGLAIPIAAVNEVSVPADGAALYTSHWSWQRNPPTNGVTCIAIRDGVVESRIAGWPHPALSSIPESPGLAYLAVRGSAATAAASLSVGDEVKISGQLCPDAEGVIAAFSGKPVLLRDGAIAPDLAKHVGIQSLFAAPRSATGLTQDGRTLLLVVADGRQSVARGLTLNELAELMRSLGAWNALNLDGGGSSSAVVRDPFSGEVVLANRPSGALQRPVPYVVGVQAVPPVAEYEADPDIAFLAVSADRLPGQVHLGKRPSIAAAVTGGPAHLVEPDLQVEAGDQVLLSARLYDSLIRVVDPGTLHTVEIRWNVIPPKSLRGRDLAGLESGVWAVSADTLSATLSPQSPGRFEIEATAVWTRPHPSGEVAMERSNTVSFGVRAVEPAPDLGPGLGQSQEVALAPSLIEGFDDVDAPSWAGWRSSSSSPSVEHSVSFSMPPATELDVTLPGLPSPAPAGLAAMLSYDFNSLDATRAVYLKPSEPLSLPEGTGIIGMWVWGDGGGHWLRATVADEEGSKFPIDFPRMHWIGWRYVQAGLPSELVGRAWLTQVYLVEFKPEMQGAGTLYIDSIAAMGVSASAIDDDESSPPSPEPSAEAHLPTPPLAPPSASSASQTASSASPPAVTPARTDRPHAPKPLEPGENLANLVRPAPGRHVITIDGSRPSLPWPWLVREFDTFKAGDDVELVVVLSGGTAVDAASLAPGGTFRDSLQAKLLLDLLDTLADGSTSVILVQDPRPGPLPAQGSGSEIEPGEFHMLITGRQATPVWTMIGHVKVVWR
ncbi:MAG: phosphodiester glycosidase family protein [Firmicutes bacterium]|nr:phosphodiester glycosidase family protein [Bacillota bacterium]